MTRKALGRGLGGLIPQAKKRPAAARSATAATAPAAPQAIPLHKIKPSPWQPRQHFADDKLQELAASIEAQGLVQPLVVRQLPGGDYELIAGERRWRALNLLRRDSAPVCVLEASNAKMRELALVENLQRDDLNALETATAYELLLVEEELTHEQIAGRLGVSRANVTNHLRLLKLPAEVKQMVAGRQISGGHARALLSLSDALSQISLAKKVVAQKISVQELERLVKQSANNKQKRSSESANSPSSAHVLNIERALREALGVKVKINDKKGKGKITIDYYTYEDIAHLLDKLGVNDEF